MSKSNDRLTLQPVTKFTGSVCMPGSKSITNRAVLLAALTKDEVSIDNMLYSDDTRQMKTTLRALGVLMVKSPSNVRKHDYGYSIKGSIFEPTPKSNEAAGPTVLNLGNAGTAMRPLTAVLSAVKLSRPNTFQLEGEPRMYERPIGDLVDAVRKLGGKIEYKGQKGFPPLLVTSDTMQGGRVDLRADKSSQYLSALLMAAPLTGEEVRITVSAPLVSAPYVQMTLDMMNAFGVRVTTDDELLNYCIPAGSSYQNPGVFKVEPDATSASYFLAAGAISGGPVTLQGLNTTTSRQGDAAFANVLERMGANVRHTEQGVEISSDGPLQGIDIDMNDMPDAAMTLAVTALFAKGETHIRNIANWRIKETDRLHAMATELRKVGATVTEYHDSLNISPPTKFNEATIETYQDHRMAMCFSLVALSDVSVHILDPDCVSKTFPDYFGYFKKLCQN